MPIGKVTNPDGTNAQATLGTVEDTYKKKFFILNNANLKKGDPVLFDVRAFDLDVDGQNVKVKIAVLELDEEGIPVISRKVWPKKFRERWDLEWKNVPDERIKVMKIKRKGKCLDKKGILCLNDDNMLKNSKG